MKKAYGISELIGKTPIIKLNKIIKPELGSIWLKLESFNPGGSIKDRVALSMIKAAEDEGKLKPKGTIVEPTSGNTGIGLAMLSASLGYNLILVMPDTMSIERRKLLKAYGAKVILTPGKEGMKGAVLKAQILTDENPDYFMPQQFSNLANSKIHMETTAREILEQMDGNIDAFVSVVGTGGTITGVSKALKKEIPNILIGAVEPAKSAVISGEKPGIHKIQGIGAGFIPEVLDIDVIDEIIKIDDDIAIRTARNLVKEEGILSGISSGAAVAGAMMLAEKLGKDKNIVTISPDTGERYLTTELFENN